MFVSKVTIGRDCIRICGPKHQLLKAASDGDDPARATVPSFARERRAKRNKIENYYVIGITRQSRATQSGNLERCVQPAPKTATGIGPSRNSGASASPWRQAYVGIDPYAATKKRSNTKNPAQSNIVRI
jgi:hypothetical protein